LPTECFRIKLQFVFGSDKYSGEERVFICIFAVSKHSFAIFVSAYTLNSIKAEAIIAAAEASLNVLGISGASKSQYGTLSVGKLG